MGLRFTKRFKIAPGVRFNLGLRGFSTSIGSRAARVTTGTHGTTTTSGIPGTGLSFVTRVRGGVQGFEHSGLLLLIAAAVILWVLWRYGMGWQAFLAMVAALILFLPTPAASRKTAVHPRLKGNGSFGVAVVGESHYAASFQALSKRLLARNSSSEWFGDALLSFEDDNQHDANAVAVRIDGERVGYLSRSNALLLRSALVDTGFGHLSEMHAAVRLYFDAIGGRNSVSLDIALQRVGTSSDARRG